MALINWHCLFSWNLKRFRTILGLHLKIKYLILKNRDNYTPNISKPLALNYKLYNIC